MAATAVALHLRPHFPPNSNTPHHQFTSISHLPQFHNCSPLGFKHKARNSIQNLRISGSLYARGGVAMDDYYGDDLDEDDDDDDDEEEDRSLDLLIRFVENIFKKVSKKARRAVKSVLPVPISTRLVGFAVNGTIILTFLWVLKAFLQVICTLGSVVFTSILLIRGIWTGISYLQESRNYRMDDDEPQSWTRTRPSM